MERRLRNIVIRANEIENGEEEQIIQFILPRGSLVSGFNEKTSQAIILYNPGAPSDELHTFYLTTMERTADLFVDDMLCGTMVVGPRMVAVFYRPTKTRIAKPRTSCE